MNVRTHKQRGFTIIEVVLVLAIASLIFLIVFLALPALRNSERDTQRRSDAGRFIAAVQTYQSNNSGKLPNDLGGKGSSNILGSTYLPAASFSDPSGGEYKLTKSTVATVSKPEPAPTNVKDGTLTYVPGYDCEGTPKGSDVGGNATTVSILFQLESGGTYCVNS